MTPSSPSSVKSRAKRLALAVTLGVLAISSSSGCATPLRVIHPLSDPPPALSPRIAAGRVIDGCPVNLVCLRPDAAVDLGLWIDAAYRWMRAAWRLAGDNPEAPPVRLEPPI